MRIKRTERGWAGHFICASRCLFRRNTLLEYEDIKIIISTVGNMLSSNEVVASRYDFEQIGCDRFYETMVFLADENLPKYIDIDVTKEITFDSDWSLDVPREDNLANDIHERVVKEIAKKLKNGKIQQQIKEIN